MQRCARCGSETAQAAPFCAQCGSPLQKKSVRASSPDAPTMAAAATMEERTYTPAPPQRPASRPSSHASRDQGRYTPGLVIADRYRLIAMLGRGGMGEVYRADDLSLGSPVALKFLPEHKTDEFTLERFRNEVRIARRISHPNVCRVYDIGQADDRVFLSMEYVDGEDLSSLLRRIGRLPADKALEIARKICAGLAAAHDKGVLHRDLKPANIMLDGRGEALIMDFGLAGIAHEIEDVRSGTPAYMAPEQLAGKEVTVRSDIYSLGLVLYELFTGRPAFDGKTLEEIVRVRRDSTPHRPSTLVRDMDPAVERVILHCLEADPENRPSTALMVAAALPGGDPLAAALAAGETPSPQVVAAAGTTTGLPVRTAVLCMVAVIAGIIVYCLAAIGENAVNKLNLPYSPEVLAQRVNDIAHQLGYTSAVVDSAAGMAYNDDYLEYLDHAGGTHPDWDVVYKSRPSILNYWRRLSPVQLVATDIHSNLLTPGLVDLDDPPPITSGMVAMTLDPQGRLVRFAAIPPERDTSPPAATPYDWKPLFTLAGLDFTQFKPTEPTWNSLGSSDERAAWMGVWPGTSKPLRVEAAAWRGKPVFFRLMGEWTEPDRMPSDESTAVNKGQVLLVVFLLVLLGGAIWLARRNYVQQKSDPQGALQLGLLIFSLEMMVWVFNTHFVSSLGLFGLFILAASGAVFLSAVFYIVYLAIEPFVRRHWPQAIISWSRLMSGRIRDPLVGRDVLFGVMLGISWAVIFSVAGLILKHISAEPDLSSLSYLMGFRRTLGTVLNHAALSVQATLGFFFLMFVFRVVFRKPWFAALAFVGFWLLIKSYGNHHWMYLAPAVIAVYGIAAYVILRFGFVALAVGIFTTDLIGGVPLTSDMSRFYVGAPIFVFGLVIAMALWGCYTALAGQKLVKEGLFD